jgi:thiol-disulfide isomerase/thioredoxin
MRARIWVVVSAITAIGSGIIYFAATSSSPPSGSPTTFGQFQKIAPAGSQAAAGPPEGVRAPEFTAPKFGGGTLSLRELRGNGVVMNFFASWCAPCRAEAPDLEQTYQKYRTRAIIFLGVDIQQDDWDDAAHFLKTFAISYPAVRDVTGDIARNYHLVGLPTTYFIDEDGVIRAKFIGAFLGPRGVRELERRIQLILPE